MVAKVTGIPFKAIDEVFKKAEGACLHRSNGLGGFTHREKVLNKTPLSKAFSRLYSYILGGNARKID